MTKKSSPPTYSHYVIMTLLLLCIVTSFFAIHLFKKQRSDTAQPLTQNSNITTIQPECTKNNFLPKNQYLPAYQVKQGDTLLSIAKTQLKDASRVNELIQLNSDIYPSLSIEKPFLEKGWKLALPPKDTVTNGLVYVVAGRVTKSAYGWGIHSKNSSTGPFLLSELPENIVTNDCAIVIYQGNDIKTGMGSIKVFSVLKQ